MFIEGLISYSSAFDYDLREKHGNSEHRYIQTIEARLSIIKLATLACELISEKDAL